MVCIYADNVLEKWLKIWGSRNIVKMVGKFLGGYKKA